jgi:hypothetical protein
MFMQGVKPPARTEQNHPVGLELFILNRIVPVASVLLKIYLIFYLN